MTTTRKVYQELATLVDAYHRCIKTGNDFSEKHAERMETIVKQYMPSGSGFDAGTWMDVTNSTGDKLVLHTSYHHMNDGGYYDGWTDHAVTVTPSLMFGFNVKIGGRDRNGFKEYAYEVFQSALSEDVTI